MDAEAQWPHAEKRPLTHLATIAMNELPSVEGSDIYPDDGLLSFFADVSEEAGVLGTGRTGRHRTRDPVSRRGSGVSSSAGDAVRRTTRRGRGGGSPGRHARSA